MMQAIVELAKVFGLLFFIAIPVAVCVAFISGFALNGAKKRAIKTAEEAGVEFTPKPVPGPQVWEIEGIIYCIGFIVIGIISVVVVALGISLPLDVSEDTLTIITAVVFGAFAVLFWSLIIFSPLLYRSDLRRLQHSLEEALSKKSQ
jgi:hypothetical protein